MRKVVYNACFGGFGLSLEAQRLYLEAKGLKPNLHKGEYSFDKHYYINEPYDLYDRDIDRHDPVLVQVVEELGDKANGDGAELRITVVNHSYRIDEYDGLESVETPDSYDWID